jgi:hypothetical protein
MSTIDFLTEGTANAIEDTPENSAFACRQCSKMYVHEDALAISMTCCGESLKKLQSEASISLQ